jgi:hypothetical protein
MAEDLSALSTEELQRQLAEIEGADTSAAPAARPAAPAARPAAPAARPAAGTRETPIRLTTQTQRTIKPGQYFTAPNGKVYQHTPGAGAAPPVKQPTIPELLATGARKLPESGMEFYKNFVQALDPRNFPAMAEGLSSVARGTLQSVREQSPAAYRGSAAPVATKREQAAAAEMGREMSRPFGYDPATEKFSPRTAAEAFSENPVGTLSTLSIPVTLGGGALAKAPGVLGRVGAVTSRVGRVMDPIALALDTATVGAKGVGIGTKATTGFLSGQGYSATEQAVRAGRAGGEEMAAFKGNMLDTQPASDIGEMVNDAVGNIVKNKNDEYVAGMGSVHNDPAVLDFAPIDKAVLDIEKLAYTSGRSGTGPSTVVNPEAARVLTEIRQVADEWRALDPAEFHTAGELDKLKQRLGVIRDRESGTPAYKAANDVYRAVRAQIVKQAPAYDSVMKAYESAKDLASEISRAAGAGDKVSAVTAMNKVQRLLMNPTNRVEKALAAELMRNAAPTLGPAVAGGMFSEPLPPGLLRAGAKAAALLAATTANPAALAALPLMSPRIAGSVAMRGGALTRYPAAAAEAAGRVYNTPAGRMSALGAAEAGSLVPEAPEEPRKTAPEAAPEIAPEVAPEEAAAELSAEELDAISGMSTEELQRELDSLSLPPPPAPPTAADEAASDVPVETVAFVSSLSPDEAKALAIVGEASPNLAEMRGVAHVLENRARRPQRFGGDIYAILTEGEFDAFKTGPERLQTLMASDRYRRALRIVQDIGAGNDKDNTGGATHFLAPALMKQKGYKNPSWAKNGRRLGQTLFFANVA